eukprot:6454848-Prymnesium_polylepis.1
MRTLHKQHFCRSTGAATAAETAAVAVRASEDGRRVAGVRRRSAVGQQDDGRPATLAAAAAER